jgi:hypothetical protein
MLLLLIIAAIVVVDSMLLLLFVVIVASAIVMAISSSLALLVLVSLLLAVVVMRQIRSTSGIRLRIAGFQLNLHFTQVHKIGVLIAVARLVTAIGALVTLLAIAIASKE